MFHAYVLRCADGTLYCGCTNDLQKRLREHNGVAGKATGAKYTRGRRPVVLVYKENFRSLAKARAREAEMKRLTRREKLAIIAKCKKK